MTIATTRPGTQPRQRFIQRSCCVEVLMVRGKYDATRSAAGHETGNPSSIEPEIRHPSSPTDGNVSPTFLLHASVARRAVRVASGRGEQAPTETENVCRLRVSTYTL